MSELLSEKLALFFVLNMIFLGQFESNLFLLHYSLGYIGMCEVLNPTGKCGLQFLLPAPQMHKLSTAFHMTPRGAKTFSSSSSWEMRGSREESEHRKEYER